MSDCKPWSGPTFGKGGYAYDKANRRLAIRTLWMEDGRDLPEKAILKPVKCGDKSCVNLDHWEVELNAI